ncbi:hypothetical protein Tsp_15675, partial [Trichinella spiralis]|uniref:hypothetical protein n=1 Tax=Trichinella spiralis TaxID=6334 RepID=UPI0001EFEFDD
RLRAGELGTRDTCNEKRLGDAFCRGGSGEGSNSRVQEPLTFAEASKLADKVRKEEKHFQERRQPHNGVMKQAKDDVMQHLEGKSSNWSERPYEPLGELDVSATAAWTITDVTATSYASENERRREERWRPSTR